MPFTEVVAEGSRFAPAANRYWLFAARLCPWANRTLIMRQLQGLDRHIGVTIVDHRMGDKGWRFRPEDPAPFLGGPENLLAFYERAQPGYADKVTVPVLWDTVHATIVNNESADIVRIFNTAFNGLAGVNPADFYPEGKRGEIDALNEWILADVNRGVYGVGLAASGEEADKARARVFGALQRLEDLLADGRAFLTGDAATEADVRLFPTIAR